MDGALLDDARAARGLAGSTLRGRLLAVPPRDRDAWVDALLGLEAPPDDAPLPRGAVPYLPAGVAEILAMLEAVPLGPDDELVDVGSGLGRVVLLAHLLSGARATGIEIQEHLVASARDRARALALPVAFVHGNAADTPLDGSVFFLYAPCNGALLARVLARIEEVARRRAVVVCTVDLELHDAAFLIRATRATSPADALCVYRSVR